MSESSMPPMRADWVGRRVVVRHSGESAEPPYHDIVGDLVEITATHAVVRRADGERRRVPLDRVVAAKVVAASTRDILAIEEVCARGWRPIDTTWSRGWLLRADHGFTRRANSALPLRPIQGSLDEVVAAARAWYGARGLPLRVSCPLPARQALDDALADRGFAAPVDVHVMVARLPEVPPPTEPVEIAPRPIRGLAGRLSLSRRSGSARLRASDPDSARPGRLRDRASRRRGRRRSSRRGRW